MFPTPREVAEEVAKGKKFVVVGSHGFQVGVAVQNPVGANKVVGKPLMVVVEIGMPVVNAPLGIKSVVGMPLIVVVENGTPVVRVMP